MIQFRYARWDGSQQPFAPDPDELFDGLAESLFEHGDLGRALTDLFRSGFRGRQGQRMPGLRDLIADLRQARQDRLGRYDLDSVLEDLRRRLDHVVELEWAAVESSLEGPGGAPSPTGTDPDRQRESRPGAAPPDPGARRRRAEAAKRTLETLPSSLSGAIHALSQHEFLDPGARQEFAQLLELLRQQMVGNVAQQAVDSVRSMTPEQRESMHEMLRALNQMLRQRLAGREPDFGAFMKRFGAFFGSTPPRTLDELLDRMQQQMARMQSLMASLSREQRAQLAQALEESLDPATIGEMAELGAMMEALRPPSELAARHRFRGDAPLRLDEAMRVMGELAELDALEQALQRAGRTGDLAALDPDRLRDLLGPDAARALRELQEVARTLEAHGYARQNGDRWELTPRTIRKLGEKALAQVFGRLARGRVGGHRIAPAGAGGELTGDTKSYEPGEPFDLNLRRSLMNVLARRGPGTPVRFELSDFEVDRFEATVSAATVLLLDQSSSMFHQGRWGSAKKVAMALGALIQGQFPRDRLFVIGFSDYAVEIRPSDLPGTEPNMWRQGTNMQHALRLARRILAKEPAGSRQVIMVTDGDPTAHLEEGVPQFSYPPTRRTILETLKEVKRCTAAGIMINTFMLDRTPYLMEFVDYVTRINRGRAFFAEPGRLGEYVLVDYVANRRRRVS